MWKRNSNLFGDRMIQIIDLFCGGGGFTKGCIDAGQKPILCVDNWDKAIHFHKVNFPDIPILKLELGGDIEKTANILEKYIQRGYHLHIHGSPPCQELSNASNHNSSIGYEMVKWFLNLVEYMKPNSWSMENVLPVASFLEKDSIPYVQLNSANFGVPQTRKRIFAGQGWLAKGTHTKEEWVSIIKALPHLEGELNEIVNKKIKQRTIEEPIRSITSKIPSQTRIVSRRKKAAKEPSSYDLNSNSHCITSLPHIIELGNIVLNNAGNSISNSNRSSSVDTPINQPNKTLTNSKPSLRFEEKQNYEKIRSLTPNETLILQSWNDAIIPEMNKKDLFQIIGNMVCPLVAKAIIQGIKINHQIDFDRTFKPMKFEQMTLF
jgi:site-specific DNA-cytosine methylase